MRAPADRLPSEKSFLDLLCDVLVGSNGDQLLIVLFPRPGTDTREELRPAPLIGTQDLTTAPAER